MGGLSGLRIHSQTVLRRPAPESARTAIWRDEASPQARRDKERGLPQTGIAAFRPRCALCERLSMDIKQDPNAIPNFNSGGRLGEAQRGEPEQIQSSVELDSTAGGDGAASESAQHESLLDDGNDIPKSGEDASKKGAGAIDGLV